MSQSLAHVLVHIIFSTKNRVSFLQSPDLRSEVHAYLVGTLRALDCQSLRVGGVADHVHILAEELRPFGATRIRPPRGVDQMATLALVIRPPDVRNAELEILNPGTRNPNNARPSLDPLQRLRQILAQIIQILHPNR
jgi:hypothetical protein